MLTFLYCLHHLVPHTPSRPPLLVLILQSFVVRHSHAVSAEITSRATIAEARRTSSKKCEKPQKLISMMMAFHSCIVICLAKNCVSFFSSYFSEGRNCLHACHCHRGCSVLSQADVFITLYLLKLSCGCQIFYSRISCLDAIILCCETIAFRFVQACRMRHFL